MDSNLFSGRKKDLNWKSLSTKNAFSLCAYPCLDNWTNTIAKWRHPPQNYMLTYKMSQYFKYFDTTMMGLLITPVGFTATAKKKKKKKKDGLIDPERHFIHSARWQPSLFSKESTLSLLHSSRASPSAWWIMSSVSSKTRLVPDRYTTLYTMVLTACRSRRGQTCQQAIGLNSLSMMRCPGWFQTFTFLSESCTEA